MGGYVVVGYWWCVVWWVVEVVGGVGLVGWLFGGVVCVCGFCGGWVGLCVGWVVVGELGCGLVVGVFGGCGVWGVVVDVCWFVCFVGWGGFVLVVCRWGVFVVLF